MRATLFGVPGSHPALAAELMLERKGIEVRRLDLVAGVHRGMLRALGFSGVTVPAVRLDGQRLQGTRTIALALDALEPSPPLVPAEPERREAVLRAEGWADEVLQPAARRLAWSALKRDRSTLAPTSRTPSSGSPRRWPRRSRRRSSAWPPGSTAPTTSTRAATSPRCRLRSTVSTACWRRA